MVNNNYEIKLDSGKWVDLTIDQRILLNDAIGRKGWVSRVWGNNSPKNTELATATTDSRGFEWNAKIFYKGNDEWVYRNKGSERLIRKKKVFQHKKTCEFDQRCKRCNPFHYWEFSHSYNSVENFLNDAITEDRRLNDSEKDRLRLLWESDKTPADFDVGDNRKPLVFCSASRNIVDMFFSMYHPVYRPYSIMKDIFIHKDKYNKYAPQVRVFHSKGDNHDIIDRLISERDPVNMAMEVYADHNKTPWKGLFDSSYYLRYYEEHEKLAPNIAIYTLAPVYLTPLQKDPLTKNVRFLHAIAYALDDKRQPDYIEYSKVHRLLKVPWLNEKYLKVFQKIASAAHHLPGISKVVMNKLGCEAFSSKYDGDFYHEIWEPTWSIAHKRFFGTLEVSFSSKSEYPKKTKIGDRIYNNEGRFPDFVFHPDFDASITLVVNAWDPHSVAGNGNSGDFSMDGFVGKHSAVHLLSNGFVNPYLRRKENWIAV